MIVDMKMKADEWDGYYENNVSQLTWMHFKGTEECKKKEVTE